MYRHTLYRYIHIIIYYLELEQILIEEFIQQDSLVFAVQKFTCKCHSVSSPTSHLCDRLFDALHQLGDSVSWQLVGVQTQFPAVTLAKRVQSSSNWDTKETSSVQLSIFLSVAIYMLLSAFFVCLVFII